MSNIKPEMHLDSVLNFVKQSELLNALESQKETINATCLVLPTGDVLWFESDQKYMRLVIEKWKTENQIYSKPPYTLGAVEVVMNKADYIAIGANVGHGCFEFPAS